MSSLEKENGNGKDGCWKGLISRKILAFVLYVLALTGFAHVMRGAPETVVVQGMWMVTYVGIFVVGGQALIDSLVPIFTKYAEAWGQRPPAPTKPA